MIEYMLSDVICHEFEKVVGKGQYTTGKAMHIGFGLCVGDSTDQYRHQNLYLFAPGNYVYVAIQSEAILEDGTRSVGPMELLCYHDSCWRDAVQSFIFKNRENFSVFRSFDHLFDWYDVLTLLPEEMEYLHQLDVLRGVSSFGSDQEKRNIVQKLKVNPFDKRTIWKNA